MNSTWLRLTVATAAAGIALVALSSPRLWVVSPRLGRPQFLLPGGEVTIELRTTAPWRVEAVELSLIGLGGELDLAPTLRRRTLGGWILAARVPRETPPDLYALRLRWPGGADLQPAAVAVLESWPERLTLIQTGDLPHLDDEGLEEWNQLVDEVNLRRPTALLLSGDLVYKGWEQRRQERFDAGLARLRVPVILAPGNHERENWRAHLERTGASYFATGIGPWRVLSLDTGHRRDQLNPMQLAWLERELARCAPKHCVVQAHHPLVGDHAIEAGRARLIDLLATHEVPLTLSAHIHTDAVYDGAGAFRADRATFPGTIFAVTTTAGRRNVRRVFEGRPSYAGYRWVVLGPEGVERYTYDLDGDGRDDPVASVPLGKLSVQRGAAGLVVRNGLNEAVEGAAVVLDRAAVGGPEGLAGVRSVRHLGPFVELRLDVPAGGEIVLPLAPGGGGGVTP